MNAEHVHYHEDEKGILRKCYHVCRHRWYIWGPMLFAFQVLMFPYEHKVAHLVWGLPVMRQIADHTGVGS